MCFSAAWIHADAAAHHPPRSYADVLAQRISDADGGSHSAAVRAGPPSLPSASGSDGPAASLSQPRLPGPAVTVEPSAEAVLAVQALFARQPEMVLDAGIACAAASQQPCAVEAAPAAGGAVCSAFRLVRCSPGNPHAGNMHAPAATKRPRRECSTPVLHGLEHGATAAAAAPSAATADTTAVPMTPQLQRRTSAPY